MRYELFEEVSSIGSNDIREQRQVRLWIEVMEMIIRVVFVFEVMSPCMFDLNTVSCIRWSHLTFELLQNSG